MGLERFVIRQWMLCQMVAGWLLAPSDVVVGLLFDTALATEESDVHLSSSYI